MSEELSWGRSTVDTSCPLDCPDACSLAVSVEQGKVVKIDGSRRHASPTATSAPRSAASPVTSTATTACCYPHVRTGPKGSGEFRASRGTRRSTSSPAASTRSRTRSGAEAILPFCYGGSNGLLTQDAVDARFFRRLGASRLARTVCAAPTGAAALGLYGKMSGVAYEDYPAARLIVSGASIRRRPASTWCPTCARRRRKRRHARRHRSAAHAARQAGRPAPRAAAGHRSAGRARPAPLPVRERARRPRRSSRDHATGVDELRAAAAPWTIDRAAGVAGLEPETLEHVRAPVRHDVAGASSAAAGASSATATAATRRWPILGAAGGRRQVRRARRRLLDEQLGRLAAEQPRLDRRPTRRRRASST